MNDEQRLLHDARLHGVQLAAPRPKTVSLCRLGIRWTGRRWVLRTALGSPVAFARRPQTLRDFTRLQGWDTPELPAAPPTERSTRTEKENAWLAATPTNSTTPGSRS